MPVSAANRLSVTPVKRSSIVLLDRVMTLRELSIPRSVIAVPPPVSLKVNAEAPVIWSLTPAPSVTTVAVAPVMAALILLARVATVSVAR